MTNPKAKDKIVKFAIEVLGGYRKPDEDTIKDLQNFIANRFRRVDLIW